jgi:tetratricopeptide (TPR) repeat protein
MGQSFYTAGQYAQARDVIEHGLASLPPGKSLEGEAEAYFRLGWLYQTPFSNPQQALDNYTRAIELDPNYAEAYANRGSAFYTQGNRAAAMANYTRAIELDPKLAVAYYNLGFAHYDQGDPAAAIADYTQAIELDPKLAQAYINRGSAFHAQGDLAAAIADYTQAIELAPEDADAYYNRGNTYYAHHNLAAATADYSQVIKLDPKYADAHYNLACVLALQGQGESVLPPLRRALELNPARYLGIIPTDHDLDSIRTDLRFKALLAEFEAIE